jgi:hypothetical protein
MFDKLLVNIKENHARNLPWSATLLQIRSNYGVTSKVDFLTLAEKIAEKTDTIVYFVFVLPEGRGLETSIHLQDIQFPPLNEMTLYAVPPKLPWLESGEIYRASISKIQIEENQFHCVYVCYRNLEARQESFEYTRFIELHLVKSTKAL